MILKPTLQGILFRYIIHYNLTYICIVVCLINSTILNSYYSYTYILPHGGGKSPTSIGHGLSSSSFIFSIQTHIMIEHLFYTHQLLNKIK